MPVVRIDGRPIGDGTPGPVATALRREFHRYAESAEHDGRYLPIRALRPVPISNLWLAPAGGRAI